MIAVVGRPAQRELGQIARADHHAGEFIRQIHQKLRPFARLTIFIRYIVNAFIVIKIGEMPAHGFGNIHLSE